MAANDNLVELSGFVSSLPEKNAAEYAAKRVRGVRGVANDLQVAPASTHTDPEIIREAGWVTLEGIVDRH